jgi:hypothetical protein
VSRNEFSHFEHANLALAVENRPERIVGVDLGSLFFVLKAIPLNVGPELFGQLGTRQWSRTNNSRELVVGLDRSHEGGIRFSFGGSFNSVTGTAAVGIATATGGQVFTHKNIGYSTTLAWRNVKLRPIKDLP